MLAILKTIAVENSYLQLLTVSLGLRRINAVEFLLWSSVFTLYTSFRAVLAFATVRSHTLRHRGLPTLLSLLLLSISLLVVSTSYLFASAGVSALVQLHYDGVVIAAKAVSLWLSLRWNSVHTMGVEVKGLETLLSIELARLLDPKFEETQWRKMEDLGDGLMTQVQLRKEGWVLRQTASVS